MFEQRKLKGLSSFAKLEENNQKVRESFFPATRKILKYFSKRFPSSSFVVVPAAVLLLLLAFGCNCSLKLFLDLGSYCTSNLWNKSYPFNGCLLQTLKRCETCIEE